MMISEFISHLALLGLSHERALAIAHQTDFDDREGVLEHFRYHESGCDDGSWAT